jgi:hypothetical protein
MKMRLRKKHVVLVSKQNTVFIEKENHTSKLFTTDKDFTYCICIFFSLKQSNASMIEKSKQDYHIITDHNP